MINIKRSETNNKNSINLTPLIDIVFLLLVFFMLTANFIENQGIGIKLPESSKRTIVKNEPITI
jgi:biopolymer transport protein ExbD